MTGLYFEFKIEQAHIRKAIKKQIKAGIPEEELHHFHLSLEEYKKLEWIRPDIEFHLSSYLFDVVKKENYNDSIDLLCVNDREEALLFARLDDLIDQRINNESNSKESPIRKMVKILKIDYIPQSFHYEMNRTFASLSTHFFEKEVFYFSPSIDRVNPPPSIV